MTSVNPDVVTLTVPDSLAGDVSAVEALYAMTDSRQSAERFALDTKIRGAPLRSAGAMNPGENASTCVNRSPFAIPSESA